MNESVSNVTNIAVTVDRPRARFTEHFVKPGENKNIDRLNGLTMDLEDELGVVFMPVLPEDKTWIVDDPIFMMERMLEGSELDNMGDIRKVAKEYLLTPWEGDSRTLTLDDGDIIFKKDDSDISKAVVMNVETEEFVTESEDKPVFKLGDKVEYFMTKRAPGEWVSAEIVGVNGDKYDITPDNGKSTVHGLSAGKWGSLRKLDESTAAHKVLKDMIMGKDADSAIVYGEFGASGDDPDYSIEKIDEIVDKYAEKFNGSNAAELTKDCEAELSRNGFFTESKAVLNPKYAEVATKALKELEELSKIGEDDHVLGIDAYRCLTKAELEIGRFLNWLEEIKDQMED